MAPAAFAPLGPTFLVHTEAGAVIERDATTHSRTLVQHADRAVYDPVLELVWYVEINQLFVLDLRARDTPAALIVRDLKRVERVMVTYNGHMVIDEDRCRSPIAALDWSDDPKIRLLDNSYEPVLFDGRAWLKAHVGRSARPAPPSSDLGLPHVSVPAFMPFPGDKELCCDSASFADRGWQLVRVIDENVGQCWKTACLFRNPKSDEYAAPPSPQAWKRAEDATPGPCGPYLFAADRTAYLVEHWLCVGEQPCQDLGGRALGWLEPGEIVAEE